MGNPYTQITEHTVTLGSHEMFYLAAGPEDGPLVIFAHGWPELETYSTALEKTGFFGTDSFYVNHAANFQYSKTRKNDGYLDMPTLFLTASFDYVCECVDSRLPEPMREHCRNLTEFTVNSGHWMAQERRRSCRFWNVCIQT